MIPTVKCEICGKDTFSLTQHLDDKHDQSVTQYQKQFPNAHVAAPELVSAVESAKRIRVPHLVSKPLAEVVADDREIAKQIQAGDAVRIPGTSRVLPVNANNADHPPVDPQYQTPKEMEAMVWAWVKRNHTYIHGESGLGKSHMIKQIAGLTQTKVWSVCGTGDALVADLYGYNQIENGDSKFLWGALPNSMKRGEPLLIEELDRLPPRVTTGLHNAISDRELYLPESGELVKAAPDWVVLATGNTRGQGDTTGRYVSAEVVDSALLRRFNTRIEMSDLTPVQMVDLIKAKLPDFNATKADQLQKAGVALREASRAQELFLSFGTADLLNLGEHLLEWEPKEAICLAFASLLDEEDQVAVVNVVEANLGKSKMF